MAEDSSSRNGRQDRLGMLVLSLVHGYLTPCHVYS